MYYEINDEKDVRKIEEFIKRKGIKSVSHYNPYEAAIYNEIDNSVTCAEVRFSREEAFTSLPEDEQKDIMNAFHDVTKKLFSEMHRFTLSDDSFDKLKREIDDYLRGVVPEKINNLF